MKRQRILSLVMALAMILSMIPTTALAAGDGGAENEYRVASEVDWNAAMGDIAAQTERDATVILTGDVGIFNNQYKYTIGVSGKHITVKSEGDGAPYSIGGKSMSSVSLTGDMTFDNVWLSLGQGASRGRGTVSSFYANGYTAEFTENFAQVITNLYGGSNGTKITASSGSNNGGTHLIINGDVICNANSQNNKVFGGGLYSGSSSTGSVAGDVVIDLGPHCRVPWVYGGGENSSVGGDVTINLNGDVTDENHTVSNITGGGRATSKGPRDGKDSGTVAGDINLNLYSGRFAAISSGGGTNETNTSSATIQSNNKIYYGTPYRYYATVGGDVNIVLGKKGAQAGTCLITTVSESLAGSLYSVIQGSVNVEINDGTQFGSDSDDHDFYGMGYNDIVEGSVNITMNGGEINGELFGLGVAVGDSEGCHKIGRTDDPKEDSYYYPKDALTITLNGGTVDNIAWFYNIRNSLKTTHTPYIYGNVIVNINGGEVGCVYFGNPNEASPVRVTPYQLPYVYGTKGMELHITGGTFTNVNQSVCAHSINRVYKGQRIYFENDEPLSLYRIYNADSNNNGDQADIIVNNTAPVQLKSYRYDNPTSTYLGNYRSPLYACGDLDIQSGTLILPGQNKLLGDFHIGENATLVTNGKLSDSVAENGFLNVGGKATGTGDLLVVRSSTLSGGEGWLNCENMTPQLPNVGEVYLRSKTTDETAINNTDANLLDLQNSPNKGLYVEYTTEFAATTGDYSYAWRIGQGEVREVTWYYEVYYQMPDGTFEKWKTAQGGRAEESQNVSISHATFDGQDLGWGEFLGTHYVFDETNTNNRLSAIASSASQNNPLKIYYKCKPHTVTYEYDQSAPTGATPPAAESNHYYSEKNVRPVAPQAVSGYTFSGWRVKSPSGLTIGADGTFTMPNDDVVLVGSWTKEITPVTGTVTLTPVDMVAYTGGDSKDHDNFPTTRYKIEAEDGIDLSKATFTVDGKVQTLPDNTKTGDIVVLDWLNDTFSLEQIGSMGLSARNAGEASNDAVAGDYKIEIAAEGITAAVDGEPVDLKWETGTLTVRNVSDPNGVINESVDIAQPVLNDANKVNTEDGIGVAVIPDNTTYYTNGNAELGVLGGSGSTGPQISLLFDDLLPGASGEDTTQLLIDRAKQDGYAFTKENSQFKYLDLINENDGNAWVSTNDGSTITIYWPCPDGININDYNFKVLHFKNLHREYRDDLEDQITNAKIEKIAVTVEDDNLVFTLPGKQNGGSFSPFALIWEAKDDGNNSGGGTTYYTLHYDSNGGTQYDNERYRRNTVVELDKTPLREGYTFTGWYADEELTERITEIKMTSNKTVYAGWEATDIPDWLNGDDHFAYIVGRNDGLVHPEADITRAEAATMFFRLLDDEVRQKNLAETNGFTDTPKDAWYNTAVSTMAKLGIVTGDPDGSFRPDDSITRAEFAAIAVRFDDSAYDGEELFTDIAGHWAQNEINAAANKGWISGYVDGTFRPQKDITRAEAVTLVNRVLNRLPENTDDLLDTMKVWPDNQPEDWYYLAVQEATNSHDFERKGDGVHERWTELTKNPDWMQYQ